MAEFAILNFKNPMNFLIIRAKLHRYWYAVGIFLFCFPILAETVPIVLPFNNPYYQKIASGFQKSFPHSTKIIYLKIQSTDEEDDPMIKAIRDLSPSLIIAIGDETVLRVRKQIKDIPLLVSMVNSLRSLEPENSNLCGYEMSLQIIEYYKILKQIKPEAQKIYALYSTEKSSQILDKGITEDIYNGLVLIKKEISEKDNFSSELEKLPKDADAFIVLNDPIYDEKNFLNLSSYSKKNKIVLFAPYSSLVDLGATLTLAPDYKNLGGITAEFANLILNKKDSCKIGPFFKFQNYLLYLNEDYANESGISIPDSLRKRIQSDKLILKGIELIDKNMIKSARIVFDKIVKDDSKNELANYYLERLIYDQTKEEITNLLIKGKTLFDNKQLESARKVYAEIIKINPNHLEAKTMYSECLKKESEILTLDAVRLDAAKTPFLAIKKLKAAIQLYSSNQEALGLLNTIRARELKELDNYLQEAIHFYNEREYSAVITKTENILLLDPNNKTAIEYLRLSKIKLSAFKKLEDCKRSAYQDKNCRLLK